MRMRRRSVLRPTKNAVVLPNMTKKRSASPGRRPLPLEERKARIIQTRVPDDLNATLQKEAKRKRVSVSQLIRNVLEDTFDLVDNVVEGTRSFGELDRRDAKRIAQSATGAARAKGHTYPVEDERVELVPARKKLETFNHVEAWQEVRVNRDTACAHCGRALGRGKPALLGMVSDGKVRPWLCPTCAALL